MTSCLQNIFWNYSSKNNGLLLLPLPTGFGKTHNTVEFIFDYFNNKLSDKFIGSEEGQSLKRIYYMTTLKNNIKDPYEKLKKLFKENGQEKEFEKYSANYNAVIDDIINNFTDIFEKQPEKQVKILLKNLLIKQEDENTYLKLKIAIKSYDNLKNNKAPEKEISKQKEELQKIENNFRKIIKTYLLNEKTQYLSLFKENQENNKKESKINNIKFLNYLYENPQYNWLKKLYPVIFFPLKKIIFLTCDKFFLPFTTILEPFYLINSQYTKDSIVFMDEIDAIKESVLRHIINNDSKEKPNLVKFVQECYTKLKNCNFTDDALCKNNPQKYQKIQETKEIATNEFEEIIKKYRLDLAYKADNLIKNEKSFLFYDFDKFIQIKDKFINCSINENNENQNKIHFVDNNPNDYTILEILKDLQKGLSKFIYYLKYHSSYYSEEKNTTKSDAVTTILTRLNINEPWRSILYKYIMSKPNKIPKPNKKENKEELNINHDHFFSNGFSYYSFYDSTAHNEDTEITKSGLSYTPEFLLLTLCQNSTVIGLSATANYESVLSNYNLNYLKENLNENWYELSHQEKETLDNEVNKWNTEHQKYNITCELSPCPTCCNLISWLELFPKENLNKKEIVRFYEGFCNDKTDYRIKRFYQTAWAFEKFLTHKNINFFVAMVNSFPSNDEKNKDGFYLPRLIDFFKMLAATKNITINNTNNNELYSNEINNEIEIGNNIVVYILKSNNLQTFSQKFLSENNVKKRIFVITSYRTLSVGINLYKRVPLTDDLININNRKTTNDHNTATISIDGMFLELPTNVTPHMKYDDFYGDTNEETTDFNQKLLKYLTQISYLANNGEISEQEKKTLIKKAFENKPHAQSLKNTISCKYAIARLLKQALGRMGRTTFLNKNEYIYLDGNFKDELETRMVINDYNSVEFREAIKTISPSNEYKSSIEELEEKRNFNNAVKHSEELHKLIITLLQYTKDNGWNQNYIRIWEKLDSDIMHTIMSDQLIEQNPELKNYCIYFEKPVEKYYYKCDNLESYKNLQISNKPIKNSYEISAQSCGLEKLKLNKHAAKYLSSIGMDLSKKEFHYWPNPVAFINLFKGRLGEHICKIILKEELNITVYDITEPEKYEKLDGYFLSKNGKKIYIDFKNWNLFADQNMELEASLEKFADKGIACETDTVVILNMIEPANSKFKDTNTTIRKNVKIIRIQALLESNNPNILTKSAIKIFNELIEDK